MASAPSAALIHKSLFIWVALLALPLLGERPGNWQAAEVGDWVLVHAGLMIGTIPADEVDALLELSRSIRPGL